jgi:hypothetical protein
MKEILFRLKVLACITAVLFLFGGCASKEELLLKEDLLTSNDDKNVEVSVHAMVVGPGPLVPPLPVIAPPIPVLPIVPPPFIPPMPIPAPIMTGPTEPFLAGARLVAPWHANFATTHGQLPTRFGRGPFIYSLEVDTDERHDFDEDPFFD